MADYTERLGDVGSLSPEDLASLESEITAAFDEADRADDLDGMSAAADALDQVRAALEAAGGGGEGEAPSTEPEGEAPVEEAPEGEGGGEAEAPEAEAEEGEEEEGGKKKAPPFKKKIAASAAVVSEPDPGKDDVVSATSIEVPEDRKPRTPARVPTAVVAGADIPGRSAGTEYTDSLDVSTAMVHRINAIRRASGGDGEQHVVATVMASGAPDERILGNDVEDNLVKIQAVVSPEAITAAGGYCAPLEVKYDIFGLGSSDRPVRDGLPGFQANRGGIRYTTPPVLSSYSGAVGLWTAANDQNPTAPATKPCLVVQCAAELTATVDAVTLCLQFGNLMTRAYPELVSRHNALGLIAHARYAEDNLLTKIGAASTATTQAKAWGGYRDVLETVARAATSYRWRYRVSLDTPLRVVMPNWLVDLMQSDFLVGLPGDQRIIAKSEIEADLGKLNVSPIWYMDGAGPTAPSTGALPGWPTTAVWYLYAEGTFIFLDGGSLDLGVVRDSTLVGTNDYKMFSETFEAIAKVGNESIKVTSTVAVKGAASGTIDVSAL